MKKVRIKAVSNFSGGWEGEMLDNPLLRDYNSRNFETRPLAREEVRR